MNAQDVHPADDHSHKFFIWHEWIQAHGPLTAENVLDYFATSMFYDKQSNNQVLRMQTVHTGVALKNEADELKRFTGIEFALVTAQPPTLFVIHKQHRYSPDAVQPLVAYFILHNRIYQAPDVYSVVSNRMLASLHSLQASLETIRAHRPDFTPRLGFVWPIVEGNAPSAAQGTAAAAAADSPRKARPSVEPPEASALHASDDPAAPQPSAPEATPAARAKKATDSRPLYLAMTTTALHAKATLVPRFRDNNSGPATEPPPPAAVPDQPAPPSAPPAPLARAGSTDGAPSKKKRKRTGTAAPQTTTS